MSRQMTRTRVARVFVDGDEICDGVSAGRYSQTDETFLDFLQLGLPAVPAGALRSKG